MHSRVYIGAFWYLYHYRRPLAFALPVPLALAVALKASGLGGAQWLSFLLDAVIAFNIQRIILTPYRPASALSAFNGGKPLLRFIGYYLLLVVLPALFLILGAGLFHSAGAQNALLMFFLITFWLVLYSRLALIFPAIAAGKAAALKTAWDLSQNYKWFVFNAVILFPLIIALLLVAPFVFLNSTLPGDIFPLSLVFDFILKILSPAALAAAAKLIADKQTAVRSGDADGPAARQ